MVHPQVRPYEIDIASMRHVGWMEGWIKRRCGRVQIAARKVPQIVSWCIYPSGPKLGMNSGSSPRPRGREINPISRYWHLWQKAAIIREPGR